MPHHGSRPTGRPIEQDGSSSERPKYSRRLSVSRSQSHAFSDNSSRYSRRPSYSRPSEIQGSSERPISRQLSQSVSSAPRNDLAERYSERRPHSKPQSEISTSNSAIASHKLSRPGRSDLSQLNGIKVIVVMGVTGSGKSTFISLLADQPVEVGHSLHSCTVDIGIYSFDDEREGTIVLVDTPGFDDTTRSNTEVLKEIGFFLAALYEQKLRFCGIIYLHRIIDPRMQGSNMKNLRMLQLVCGKQNFKHVALATTMWEKMKSSEKEEQIGRQRLMELRRPEFYGEMLGEGRDIIQHDGSRESARAIVRLLTEQNKNVVLDIQHELIDERMSLQETSAGQYLLQDFFEAKKMFDADIAELEEIMEDAMNKKDEKTIQAARAERKAAETKIMQHAQDREGLNITMQQLAREKHPQYRDLAMDFREPEGAISSEIHALERRIRDLKILLKEGARERETKSTWSSRESRPHKLNRSREQTGDREREQLELKRDLAQRRSILRETRRESPVLMLLNGMFGGLFGS